MMIVVDQIKINVLEKNNKLNNLTAKKIGVKPEDIKELRILKMSIDARKKPDVFYVYQVCVALNTDEKRILKRFSKDNSVRVYKSIKYTIPRLDDYSGKRPVVVGAGPAGIFAALYLSKAGLKPIVIERGKRVEDRTKDVEDFFSTGVLNPQSNCLFGEGGAGAFSDGKLNTLVNDKFGRSDFVLNSFVDAGADSKILYDYKPHVGTDVLIKVLKNLRNEIINAGGEFRFNTKLTDIIFEDKKVSKIIVNNESESSLETIPVSDLVLAIGHSARDTFEMLYNKNMFSMKAKEFAVGFRIEHPQDMIQYSLFGEAGCEMEPGSYKLTYNHENGRGIYSFCMCPGGYVVNSSSEQGLICCNGMSYSKRDSKNANSAIVVSVGAKEFDLNNPLSGLEFQRRIEKKAYELCDGKLPQQLYGDFIKKTESKQYGEFASVTKGATDFGRLDTIYPNEINQSIEDAMKDFGRRIKGFDRPDAILTGVETRTSSPVRIERGESFEGIGTFGVYPCGEGAGYAGGIMSAAMDGLKVAEALVNKIKEASFG